MALAAAGRYGMLPAILAVLAKKRGCGLQGEGQREKSGMRGTSLGRVPSLSAGQDPLAKPCHQTRDEGPESDSICY